MTNFKTNDWDLRNAWPLPTGELACRPALVSLVQLVAQVAGFTVRNQRTNVIWNYILSGTSLSILDENFDAVQDITHGATLPNKKIPFTCAVVEDEILISSPYLPTYWGVIGSGLILATKVTSVNPNTTAIDIPKGLCVGWAGRAVISDGEAMYFSDALAPRTFVAENVIDPPGGTIYGLHVNSGGALIVVTSTGVYALPEDAAASGQIVVGIFSKLTDYGAIDYLTSACSHGRVYGLTKKGYRFIDVAGSNEVLLSEQSMSRSGIPRIAFEDYRSGTIFDAEHGPVISIAGYLHVSDLSTKLDTWWVSYNTSTGNNKRFDVVGVLSTNDGEEQYLVAAGDVLGLYGNRDDLVVPSNEQTLGQVAGRIIAPPEASPSIREIDYTTDTEDSTTVFVNTASKTSTAKSAVAPVIGTAVWDSGVYREVPLRNRLTNWAVRSSEVTTEISISEYPSKLPQVVNVEFKGPGKSRPNS